MKREFSKYNAWTFGFVLCSNFATENKIHESHETLHTALG